MFMRQFVLRAALPVLPRPWLVLLAALLGTALLAACSSGGGSVTIANSQPPDSQTTDFGIVYIKRTVPTTQDDLRLRRAFVPQADLYLLNPDQHRRHRGQHHRARDRQGSQGHVL